jgi:hypothetical protein
MAVRSRERRRSLAERHRRRHGRSGIHRVAERLVIASVCLHQSQLLRVKRVCSGRGVPECHPSRPSSAMQQHTVELAAHLSARGELARRATIPNGGKGLLRRGLPRTGLATHVIHVG